MKSPKCGRCGSSMTVSREEHDYSMYGVQIILTNVEVRRCQACDEVEVAIPRIEQLHRSIAEAIVSKTSRLTGGEIKFLRKHLGWSGQDFAAHMGVADETISRWENEKERPGAIADRAIRLMVAVSTPVEEYPTPPLDTMALIGQESEPISLKATPGHGTWKMESC